MSYGGYYGGGGGGDETEVKVSVPSDQVGRIIGKGGARIKQLQADSDCRINVDRDGGEYGGQKSVTLRGSPAAVEDAKRMIDDIVNSEPRGGGGGGYSRGGGGGYGGDGGYGGGRRY